MASAAQTGARIFVLVLLIIVLIFSGLLWFDYLGLIQVKPLFAPVLHMVGVDVPEEPPEAQNLDTLMLEKERLAKQLEALDIRDEELDRRESGLDTREAEIEQKLEVLQERENGLKEQENSFNQRLKLYENKRANLRQAAQYYVGMPPQQAVDRLLEMDDQDVIDILRTVEEIAQESGEASTVSYWLSLMPADRAAVLSRKMIVKP
ncbi:periplasmic-type flagellar collar protein FlbB [Sediminispirochaeta bajacaliforniensis]|uniref:periplasmic-type flagellar collar protein FlbB n=1 Tax=Sediminispirochaeta bajacaliforniensis TaxID=148 RepID=UPI0003742EB0|nr:flagellar protein FlbB [Sediminispirochaeta bajacaliforniensis]